LSGDPFLDGGFTSPGDGFPIIVGDRLVTLNRSNIAHLACPMAIWFVVEAKEALADHSRCLADQRIWVNVLEER
jgi:hypothetical protein